MKRISESILSKKTGLYIKFPNKPDLDELKEFFERNHFLDYGKPATEDDLIKFAKDWDCPAYSIGECIEDDLISFWIKWTKPEKSNVVYMVRTLSKNDAYELLRTPGSAFNLYYIIITKPKYDFTGFNNFDVFRRVVETSGGI